MLVRNTFSTSESVPASRSALTLRRSAASQRLVQLTGVTATLIAAILAVTRPESLALPQDEADRAALLSHEGLYPIDVVSLPHNTDVLPLLKAGKEIQVGSVFVSIDTEDANDPKIVVRKGGGGTFSFAFTNDMKRDWFKDIVKGDTQATLRKIDAKDLVGSNEEIPALEFKAVHRGLKFIGKDVSVFTADDLEIFLRTLSDADPAQKEMYPPIAGYFPKKRDEHPMGVRRVGSTSVVAQK